MKKQILSFAFALAVSATLFTGCAPQREEEDKMPSNLVVYPEYPAAVERDAEYAVTVEQKGVKRPLVVYNHCEKSSLEGRTHGGDVNRRFCEFAFDGAPVRVDVRCTRDVSCYKVFPARRGLKSAFKDGVISVWLDKPAYFGVQLNDSDKTILSVFADAPEKPEEIPQKGAPGVMFVEGWVDAPGRDGMLALSNDVKEVYLAPGSVLNARMKIRTKGLKMHGRGMVLDPMSDIFRYDQTKNTSRGVIVVEANDVTLSGFKMIDARTFNVITWSLNTRIDHLKLLASMMCSDGFTVGGRGFVGEHSWLYVGDNALVVSGAKDAVYRDLALGTSCAAIFPQGSNAKIVMEGIDVFRADDGLINNFYNWPPSGWEKKYTATNAAPAAAGGGSKWNEMNAGKVKRRPGPQDMSPCSNEFLFRDLSGVDCTLFSHFFVGRNMGTLPKTFAFENCSVPGSTGRSHYSTVGKKDGTAFFSRNDEKKWLYTDNYAIAFTNLWIDGVRATFPAAAFDNPSNLRVTYATNAAPQTVALAPDRHVVSWKAPARPKRAVTPGANLVAEKPTKARSLWQRAPSWSTKLEATGRDEKGSPLYRLVQCERNAGLQAILTDDFLAYGNGRWTLSFEVRARSETATKLNVRLYSNERSEAKAVDVTEKPSPDALTPWKRFEVAFDTKFDPKATDLVALFVSAKTPTDELVFRDFRFARAK